MATILKDTSRLEAVAVDTGNRFIKFFDRKGTPHKIPSYIKKLEDWQDELEADSDSVVIVLDGQRYVVGKLGKELGGSPAFLGNKSQLAHLLILPAIYPIEGSKLPLEIEKLILTLPDSRHKENKDFLKSLEGTQTVTRNGFTFTYTIRKVVVVDECHGAYKFAVNGGLYQHPNRINGVLDCGGGTTLGKLFTPNGNIHREADLVLPGTVNLARAIATSLTPKLGYTPDLDLILDGIGDGSYQLGTTDCNFKREFHPAHDAWLESIRTRLRATWQPFYNQIAEVLIVGGSAPLLKSFEVKTNGRFKIVPTPQFMGIKGMQLLGGKS